MLEHGYAVGIYNNNLLISIGESSVMSEIIEIANIILTGNATHGISLIGTPHTNNNTTSDTNNNNNNSNHDNTNNLELINKNKFNAILNKYTQIFRKDTILNNPVFNRYHSETKMMRYIKKLEMKDI